ncbi:VWA domain-containing protein [Streptomyces sp. GbtcB6]|nr:VWA domain-containing protein [Streptomyces sp. GbtcB6]
MASVEQGLEGQPRAMDAVIRHYREIGSAAPTRVLF